MKLKHDSITSFFFDGMEYAAGKGGVFDLPEVAVMTALEFGFEPVAEPVKKRKDDEQGE